MLFHRVSNNKINKEFFKRAKNWLVKVFSEGLQRTGAPRAGKTEGSTRRALQRFLEFAREFAYIRLKSNSRTNSYLLSAAGTVSFSFNMGTSLASTFLILPIASLRAFKLARRMASEAA